ncbi:MAG: hypothetical protein KatS3mg110_3632 [Pirellulaceae bacterium]|nr:MAG: hypothetical protein KatS3mg110_3632 [Pirellulaceae bacterium]
MVPVLVLAVAAGCFFVFLAIQSIALRFSINKYNKLARDRRASPVIKPISFGRGIVLTIAIAGAYLVLTIPLALLMPASLREKLRQRDPQSIDARAELQYSYKELRYIGMTQVSLFLATASVISLGTTCTFSRAIAVSLLLSVVWGTIFTAVNILSFTLLIVDMVMGSGG